MADGAQAVLHYLGVARSLSGRAWRESPADPATARRHAQRFGLPDSLARCLAARGVDEDGAETFLSPTLKALFPDPSCFTDMDKAAGLILDAVETGTKITVFADYDVDGAASAALLVRWLRAAGREADIYVPDRQTEGYGPSPAAFARIKAGGTGLVITVDCGAAAHQALEAADQMALPVVVIDHHLMRADSPPAAALVNPNRPGCNSGQGHLAAAGVTFVLLAALNREARARGLFDGGKEPDLRQWLDLAAMGAICDVTQLTGFNRALTSQGLKVMSAWSNPGLRALMEVARADGPATTYTAGFILGPRINAGGRIGRSDLGARLLSSDDAAEAAALAEELDALNAARREVEREVLDSAVALIEGQGLHHEPVILVADDHWHGGVVGIVAGRLRERYRKPCIVVGIDPVTGVGKGSGRSQAGVNLGRAVQAAFDAGHLLAGGGHAMAAGLTVQADRLPGLRAYLIDRLSVDCAAAAAAEALEIDALVTPASADRDLFTEFQRLAPFGPGNPEPMLAMADVLVEQATPVRGGHIRCILTDGAGARLRAVSWRSGDTPTGKRLLEGGAVHVAGRLKADDYMGRKGVQFEIEDIADPRVRH